MQSCCLKHLQKLYLTLGVCAVVWAEFMVACQCPRMGSCGTEAQGRALSLAYSCTLMWQPPNCTSAHLDPPGDAPPAGQEWHAFCFAEKQGLYKRPILKTQNKYHLKVRACSSGLYFWMMKSKWLKTTGISNDWSYFWNITFKIIKPQCVFNVLITNCIQTILQIIIA